MEFFGRSQRSVKSTALSGTCGDRGFVQQGEKMAFSSVTDQLLPIQSTQTLYEVRKITYFFMFSKPKDI